MRGYDRYEDEDLDEYEEDGEEQEEDEAGEDEYKEEEAPERKKEVLDYLELRQRLKEEKRKKLKKESGTFNSSSRDKKNSTTRDSYGSFFGPSQPVIAQRVIQESKSLLENPNLARRVIKSNQTHGNKSSGSALSASKSQASGQRPKPTNRLQTKVQMLKNTRDYSFLLSDDAELPAPKKVPPPRNISAPKHEARSAQISEKSKDSSSNSGRKVFNSREDKKPMAAVNRMQPKVGTERLASGNKQVQASVDSRKHLGGSNGTVADHRKQVSISNGSGPGRPVVSKSVPSKVPVGTAGKKVAAPFSKTSAPGMHKPTPSKLHPPVSKQPFPRKEEYQVSAKPKVLPKQVVPPPKPKQVIRPPRNSARDTHRDERPKKRPVRHDDDDEDPEYARSLIRKMFGYNPGRYHDVDDDSDMEANFDEIMREEKRSAKIARQEDEEELLKIEEEERRERLRKEAKRRKLSR